MDTVWQVVFIPLVTEQIRISVVCLVMDGTDSYLFVSCRFSPHSHLHCLCPIFFRCVLVWVWQVMHTLKSTRKLRICHNHGMHVFRMEPTSQHHCQIQKYQAFILGRFCGHGRGLKSRGQVVQHGWSEVFFCLFYLFKVNRHSWLTNLKISLFVKTILPLLVLPDSGVLWYVPFLACLPSWGS